MASYEICTSDSHKVQISQAVHAGNLWDKLVTNVTFKFVQHKINAKSKSILTLHAHVSSQFTVCIIIYDYY